MTRILSTLPNPHESPRPQERVSYDGGCGVQSAIAAAFSGEECCA